MVAMCPPRSLSDGVKVMTAEEPSSREAANGIFLERKQGCCLRVKARVSHSLLSSGMWQVAHWQLLGISQSLLFQIVFITISGLSATISI